MGDVVEIFLYVLLLFYQCSFFRFPGCADSSAF
jgi:hypothetical protein